MPLFILHKIHRYYYYYGSYCTTNQVGIHTLFERNQVAISYLPYFHVPTYIHR